MPVKCSRCSEKNLECRVLPGADRCGECTKSVGRDSCDVFGSSASSWASVQREEARLEAEEEEAMAKILRLRKQQRKLREKAGKMLQHDLHTIDELEAFEEKERLEKERAEQAERALQVSSSSEVDPSSFVLSPTSEAELAAWMATGGFLNGISPGQLGSSSS